MAFRTGLLIVFVVACTAPAQVLYKPTLGNLPDAQGWSYYGLATPITDPLQATRSFDSGTIQAVLDTSADRGDRAGYSSHNPITQVKLPAFPVLPVGTKLLFNLDIRAESHDLRDDNGDLEYDRAGFSVIALLSNGKGVELGFFSDTVWGYDYTGGLFLHAEETVHDTTLGTGQNYELLLGASTYTLSVGGSPLLTGPMRDYSGFGTPYNLTSYLFIGDDTSSADSISAVGEISVALPEPSMVGLLVAAFLIRRWRESEMRGENARNTDSNCKTRSCASD